VRRDKRGELVERARAVVRRAFDDQLRHLRAGAHERAAAEIAACAERDGGFAAAAGRCALRELALHMRQPGLHACEALAAMLCTSQWSVAGGMGPRTESLLCANVLALPPWSRRW